MRKERWKISNQKVSLSLSANPKYLIKGIFSAVTDVFASFFRKNDVCENNKHSTKLAGGTKQAILAPVILGHVPRILLQQGTNLVNKFALLLHKCRFAQDSRDKPENDGSWRCWLSICCSFFNYPSPARGEVLNNITFKGLYAVLLKRRIQSSTQARKAQLISRQTKLKIYFNFNGLTDEIFHDSNRVL